jgi:hypothetical protein
MAGSATDDWLTFADTHFIPHESIERCEGWPKGKPLFCRTVAINQLFCQARWAQSEFRNSPPWA